VNAAGAGHNTGGSAGTTRSRRSAHADPTSLALMLIDEYVKFPPAIAA
jgi:hypothetical protein